MTECKEAEKLKILVVDDLAHERYSLKRRIGQVVKNGEFLEAGSVEAARKILSGYVPLDLAVIDLDLEDGREAGGLEVVRLIRGGGFGKFYSRTPIIVITVLGQLKNEALKAKADVFVRKLDDGSDEELRSAIRELLGR